MFKIEADNYKPEIFLQLHDELEFDVYKSDLEELKSLNETKRKVVIKSPFTVK